MENPFKKKWLNKASPLAEESLDMLIGDLTLQMHTADSFAEWKDLFHRREALQIQRDTLNVPTGC